MDLHEDLSEDLPKVLKNKSCILTLSLFEFCVACCGPQTFYDKDGLDLDLDMKKRDICM